MGSFEEAHYYIKDMMETTILNSIKFINSRDKNMKLIISGGDVLTRYFEGPSIFLTHDFDIKLTVNKHIDLDQVDKEIIYDYQAEIAKIFKNNLNNFYVKNQDVIDNKLGKSYNSRLVQNTNNPFKAVKVNKSHTRIVYTLTRLNTLKEEKEEEDDEIIDLWVALPETIRFPYYTFLGEDPILSLDGSDYYMPSIEIEGVLIAGLGYVLWDTQRMIKYSMDLERKGKSNKLQRYIGKQKAIYNDLNHPLKRMSCIPFKKFVEDCAKKESVCSIDGKQFYDVESALEYAMGQGYLSREHISEIEKGKYSLPYVCAYIDKIKDRV